MFGIAKDASTFARKADGRKQNPSAGNKKMEAIGMAEKTVTLAELAETCGRKYDTIFRRAKRMFPAEAWGKNSAVTEDVGRVLLGDWRAPVPQLSVDASALQNDFSAVAGDLERTLPLTVRRRTPRAFSPKANDVAELALPEMRRIRRFTFNAVCLAIVLGHAALIWYDCAALWQTAGQIGGGLAFLFVVCCVLLATDATRVRTSAAALWIVAGVDIAAWWVHYPVFTRQMTAYDIKAETGVLCAVICALSFFALVLYRDEKID